MLVSYFNNTVSIYIYIQFISIFLFLCSITVSLLLVDNYVIVVSRYSWYIFVNNIKFVLIGGICLINIINLVVVYSIYRHIWTDIYGGLFWVYHSQVISFLVFYTVLLNWSELTVVFVLLISFLYPVILILMQYDFSLNQYKYFCYMMWLYVVIYIFISTVDLLLFYIIYELMIGIVFFIMYLTSNSRGSIEAILFFLGWAVIGSFCLGIAVLYIIIVGGLRYFDMFFYIPFSVNERYLLYCLLFIGFGTKLSIWPFWYWLPRAHVEVSTGMSIFLSCILIKVCFYGFFKMLISISGEIVIFPFIFLAGICVFDLTVRLIIQVDLKAITAYGSVLHVNLFLILFLVDTGMLNNGLIFYIWGHSYATAGVFFVINLIERCCGSRLTFELVGIYKTNPVVGLASVLSLLTFLEFPLCFFFWGEVWLWVVTLDTFPLLIFLLMFISVVCYIIVFFRIWWGTLFGGIPYTSVALVHSVTIEDLFVIVYIIMFQYLVGFYPSMLCWYTIS